MKDSPTGNGDQTNLAPPHRKRLGRLIAAAWVAVALATVIGDAGNAQPTLPRTATAGNSPSLTTHFATQPGKPHQLVVVDADRKAIAVYKIDPDSGAIAFVSMRHIGWDLQMDEFNARELRAPEEIRAALEAAR